jgi:F-type H+-transporting ATPase subunit b
MNSLILLAAGEGGIVQQLGEQASQVGKTFGANVPALVANAISFLLVAVILKVWAIGPIQKMLEERREKIAQGLAAADKAKAELANAQAKTQEILAQANVQANKFIEEARAAAARITETETQKAVQAAKDIIEKARQSNEAELARMKTELRREVGRLVVATSAQVTGKILTLDDQKRLAEETNRQLAA